MKKIPVSRILLLLFFVFQLHMMSGQSPAILIVMEKTQDKVVLHGLEKLTQALQEKQIPFESVGAQIHPILFNL